MTDNPNPRELETLYLVEGSEWPWSKSLWSQFVVLEMNIDQMPAKEGQKLVEILNVDDK